VAFNITITDDAESHLRSLSKREQRMVEAAILSRLVHQPETESRTVKRLRPNPLATYELRVGNIRVLYNVEGREVILLVVGRKVGNMLVVKGQEFHGHQDNSSKPSGS
jgi:mRNA-degrading endonuclease RelE of RelBE toxin-antitoxin system